ncbi:class I SAM-dependent methyltransferase [Paenalkalicoccus suaedae]|uniref:Class I SAM-dependent methyltransferase n=1 Tax=Paenalkalicoccus suaedae TaxID=2592382 RepID=A0A859FEJ1_9BACI|nr:class I SAM-dependent methyltransferase [Paenalkalicoccus suaedae]QKS71004.1 class I SAM-dependent methyltransferase [Paenalkalicoccus suaedae]
MSEISRVLQARNWMKTNEDFLSTWHAHVGYKMDLFHYFANGASVHAVASKHELSEELLQRWVDVGLEIGHLKTTLTKKIKAKPKMVRYASRQSEESVGILLTEMMELHIPTLLEYPDLMKSNSKITYLSDKFADVVAETSTLLEKAAASKILKIVKTEKPKSAIDLGCGLGGYLRQINEKYPKMELTGVEMSEEVVQKARKKLDDSITIQQGDIVEFLDSYEKQVDFIMAHNLLYYFSRDERINLYKRMSKILRNGGVISFICPIVNARWGRTFTTAFNTFMTAHENLHPLPSLEELEKDVQVANLHVKSSKPLIREGGWYLITVKKELK